jgi:hypothetical protein
VEFTFDKMFYMNQHKKIVWLSLGKQILLMLIVLIVSIQRSVELISYFYIYIYKRNLVYIFQVSVPF